MYDLVLENGRLGSHEGEYGSIGIEKDKIMRVAGAGERLQGKRRMDVEGAWIFPGFIDAHTHLLALGLSMIRLDLSHTESREQALELVRKALRGRRGERALVGYGWDESAWGERDYLRREELDFSDVPVILYRRDHHMAVLNTAALRKIGLEKRRNGVVKEDELKLLEPMARADRPTVLMALKAAFQKCLSEGITSVRDIVDAGTYQTYMRLSSLPVDVKLCLYRDGFEERFKEDSMFWGVKLFLDGSIGAGTAAYSGWSEKNLLLSESNLRVTARYFWKRGVSLAVHAIGDVAVETAVSVLSRSDNKIINSIEHFELADDRTLERMGPTVACCQPNFLQWSGRGGLYEIKLGRAWAERNNAYRRMLDRGVHLAFGSDCMPIGPLYGIKLACTSPRAAQRISAEEAVRCYTEAGAKLLNLQRRGEIKTGFIADLTVVRGDITKSAEVVATVKSGTLAYQKLAKAQ
jgi:predicted amidohydrolase YtcJ